MTCECAKCNWEGPCTCTPDATPAPQTAPDAIEAMRVAVAQRAREIAAQEAERDRDHVRRIVEEWQLAAQQATGMSREQLLAEYDRLGLGKELPIEEVRPDARTLQRRRLMAAGAPERHIRHICDVDAEDCPALDRVRQFAGNSGILVLSGNVGTRKTGSACTLLALPHKPGEGAFIKAPDLLAVAFEDKPRWLKLRGARFAVLDDLGTEVADEKGHWLKTFNTLIDGWYDSCATVILTTNITAEEFGQRYGARIARRINEAGAFFKVPGAGAK